MAIESEDMVYTRGDFKKITERSWMDIEYDLDGASAA